MSKWKDSHLKIHWDFQKGLNKYNQIQKRETASLSSMTDKMPDIYIQNKTEVILYFPRNPDPAEWNWY